MTKQSKTSDGLTCSEGRQEGGVPLVRALGVQHLVVAVDPRLDLAGCLLTPPAPSASPCRVAGRTIGE